MAVILNIDFAAQNQNMSCFGSYSCLSSLCAHLLRLRNVNVCNKYIQWKQRVFIFISISKYFGRNEDKKPITKIITQNLIRQKQSD